VAARLFETMSRVAETETVFFEGPDAFEAWLEVHGESADGVARSEGVWPLGATA